MAYADLPDLGPLTREALAERRGPGGESFADMAARVIPALEALAAEAAGEGPVAVVAHAGTVRAGLALALDALPAALAFEVAPLSVTRLRCLGGAFSVVSVNVAV
jgi:alpha-ribazole phosphatase